MDGPAFSDWIGGGAHAIPKPVVTAEGPLDATYEDLVPGRTVTLINWAIDQYALRVIYTVNPPIHGHPPPGTRWELSGSDDLGNEYLSVGGASGLSHDRERTEGVESMQLPDPSATYLDLVLESGVETGPRHVLRIEPPPGVQSAATR